jgi:glucose/arabinose dehydrogenase
MSSLIRSRATFPAVCRLVSSALLAASVHAAAAQEKPPPWAQGRPKSMETSPLKPHPPKTTVTAESEIPIQRIQVPPGFEVELWAHGMPGVRMMARGDKGTIYAGTRAIGRVYEVKDRGGLREHRILVENLKQPNGVAFRQGSLYVAAIDRMLRFDGIEDRPDVQPVELTERLGLPTEEPHGWKFLAFGPDGKLYVPVGAPCNICEPSERHAQIRRYRPDGWDMEVVARGVRNSVGFDFHPTTGELWFTDNGRDWMGDEGPEDELNRVTRPGANYGFPYCHAGGVPDRDVKKADPCNGVTKPVALLGAHTAALGMRFYTGDLFPAEYRNTIFVARRGSWNRSKLTGFDVVNVAPSADGGAAKVAPFMTGFMDAEKNAFWGRPADVLQLPDGSLLVSDEQMGAIYRVTHAGGRGKR